MCAHAVSKRMEYFNNWFRPAGLESEDHKPSLQPVAGLHTHSTYA